MKVTKTKLEGVLILEPKVFGDSRGFFMETFNKKTLLELGIDFAAVQDNQSLSAKPGTIRGLHYQLNPMAQAKIVRVLSGLIYDVAVDIRRGSPTFGQWVAVELSAENKRQLIVPRGFAHGCCTLSENTQLLYKVDNDYSSKDERGISWNDPVLGISWPTSSPTLSQNDRNWPLLEKAEINFNYSEL